MDGAVAEGLTAGEILRFVESLRESGFRYSSEQWIALSELLLCLDASGIWPRDASELAAFIAPLICSTGEQQRFFHSRCSAWLGARALRSEDGRTAAEGTATSTPTRAPKTRRRLAIFTAVIVILMALMPRSRSGHPATTKATPSQIRIPGSVTNDGLGVSNAAVYFLTRSVASSADGAFVLTVPTSQADPFPVLVSHENYGARLVGAYPGKTTYLAVELTPKPPGPGNAALPPPTPPPPASKPDLRPVPLVPKFTWERGAIAALIGALFCATWLLLRRRVLARWARARQADAAAGRVAQADTTLFSPLLVRRTAALLRRPRDLGVGDLDSQSTVNATAENAGYFRPVYTNRRHLPGYLALIERLGPQDQLAAYHEALVMALFADEEGDRIRIVNYEGAPSRQLLQRLAGQQGDRVLWVFCEPDCLQHPFTGGPAAWLSGLTPWPERVILSPLVSFEAAGAAWWRWRPDADLAEPSLEGLLRWASERRPGIEPAAVADYPPLLQGLPERWIGSEAPSSRLQAKLAVQLRRYLGADGMVCLAACAAVGTLTWKLTEQCVKQLAVPERQGEVASRLVRLPWFRCGRMPDWLRERLSRGLPRGEAARVRQAMVQFAAQPGTEDATSSISLHHLLRRFRRRQRAMRAVLDDYILLAMLRGHDLYPQGARRFTSWEQFKLRHGVTPLTVGATATLMIAMAAVFYTVQVQRTVSAAEGDILKFGQALAGATTKGPPATPSPTEFFLGRVLDVAASQVDRDQPSAEWRAPFVSWCFVETAAIVGGSVRAEPAATESAQWTKAVGDPGVKSYRAGHPYPVISPGFVYAQADKDVHVGLVETVSGDYFTGIEPYQTYTKGTLITSVRRRAFRISSINLGFIDYANSRISSGGEAKDIVVPTPEVAAKDKLKTAEMTINVFGGNRQRLPKGTRILLNIRDGNQQIVSLPNNGLMDGPSVAVTGLPFHDNFGDNYTVLAAADGYQQTGFSPVIINPSHPTVLDLMLLRKDSSFNFSSASLNAIGEMRPKLGKLLAAGVASQAEAQTRYADLMEQRPPVLACLLNIAAALEQIHLPVGTPEDYLRELIWDNTMAQDRLFGWADPAIINQIIQATKEGEFAPEVGPALFLPGVTRSYKQIQFGEADIEILLHDNDHRIIDGTDCIKLEIDMDYYKDLQAHTLLEVATNARTAALTDPRQVYVLRWMAGRHPGVPNFDPLYTLE